MRDSLGGCASHTQLTMHPLKLVTTLLLSAAYGAAQAPDTGWVPLRYVRTRPASDSQAWNPDTIIFRNGHRLTPELWFVSYVGQLPRGARPPYLVLAAVGCYDCDDMTHIYIAWPSHGQLQTDEKPYAYPGTQTPLESRTATFRSRLFLGKCLEEPNAVLVWFQDERDSTGNWVHSVYRVRVQGDTIERSFLTPPPSPSSTLLRTRSGQCAEIKRRDQVEY
jgi:hypothetical protein